MFITIGNYQLKFGKYTSGSWGPMDTYYAVEIYHRQKPMYYRSCCIGFDKGN